MSTSEEKEAHLFVLVHGLWGGPNHMSTIERAVKESLTSVSTEEIVLLKPSSFRFWKTYDGLKCNAERVITDIFYEIETLKLKQNLKVTKISVVGYSLGGLIARYAIGVLNELNFLDSVTPVAFSTFATPHIGVEFFNDNFFDHTANRVGQYLFGKSGRQLFLTDHQRILYEMAQPDSHYFKGLEKFQIHLLLANIKNDRTVAFYTSYITEYSPFDNWDTVKVEYLSELPQSRVGHAYIKPKIVDLTNCVLVPHTEPTVDNSQEATSILRSNKFIKVLIIIFGASFLIPIWIPLVLTTSLITSVYSMIKIRILRSPELDLHWTRVKESVFDGGPVDVKDAKTGEERRHQRLNLAKHESFKGDTSELTENTMENILYAEERFIGRSPEIKPTEGDDIDPILEESDGTVTPEDTAVEPASTTKQSLFKAFTSRPKKKIIDIKTELNDKMASKYLSDLRANQILNFPLFVDESKLKLSEDKKTIIANLNKINWIKMPVYLDSFNAHDGIVARRGEKTSPKGSTTIYFWTSFLRNHMGNTKVD